MELDLSSEDVQYRFRNAEKIFRSHIDGYEFEDSAESRLLEYVKANAETNNLQSIVDTIDKFCWSHGKETWMMNVGDVKGKILDSAIQERKPQRILELGAYVGYSSLRMLNALKDVSPTAHITTIDPSPISQVIATQLWEYAGVADRITLIKGILESSLSNSEINKVPFDFIFIDHVKDDYLSDFKLLEQHKLIIPKTVTVFDNILVPGAPEVPEYLKNNPNYKYVQLDSKIEYMEVRDIVAIATRMTPNN